MTSSSTFLLNYHDAVLYSSDLNLLRCQTEWLNDACIHFYLTWLQQHESNPRLQKEEGYVCKKTCLDPCVVSYIMYQLVGDDDDIIEEMKNIKIEWMCKKFRKNLLFIPINDHHGNASKNWTTNNTSSSHGTHWSLLVAELSCRINSNSVTDDEVNPSFYHFDSSSGHNMVAAQKVANKIKHILNVEEPTKEIVIPTKNMVQNESPSNVAEIPIYSTAIVEECETPQQTNSHDCGIYCCAMVDAFMNHYPPKFDSGTDSEIFCSKFKDEHHDSYNDCTNIILMKSAIQIFLRNEWRNDHIFMAMGLRKKMSDIVNELIVSQGN